MATCHLTPYHQPSFHGGVEDLAVKQLTQSAKGMLEKPGDQVRAKSRLDQMILETGWGQLCAMLDYKAGRVTRVPPQHTRQTCHVCGYVDKRNRKTRSKFKYLRCGHESHTEFNAAKIIKASAIGASARRRVEPSGYPMIRENVSETTFG